MHRHRFRVSTSISVPVLEMVRDHIAHVLGQVPVALLQEVEHDEVVVELALVQSPDVPETPSDLAKMVARTARSFEVLSAWDDVSPDSTAIRVPGRLLHPEDATQVPAACRAIADDLPTTWLLDKHTWQFALPHGRGDQRVVALSERRGYDRRFSMTDVAATRRGLEMGPSATSMSLGRPA